jgi:hypothetical protein
MPPIQYNPIKQSNLVHFHAFYELDGMYKKKMQDFFPNFHDLLKAIFKLMNFFKVLIYLTNNSTSCCKL